MHSNCLHVHLINIAQLYLRYNACGDPCIQNPQLLLTILVEFHFVIFQGLDTPSWYPDLCHCNVKISSVITGVGPKTWQTGEIKAQAKRYIADQLNSKKRSDRIESIIVNTSIFDWIGFPCWFLSPSCGFNVISNHVVHPLPSILVCSFF